MHICKYDDALSVLRSGVLQMAMAIHLSIAISNQIERLKYVLLDKEQLLLFNQIPNKRISINELHIKKQQDNWVEN